MEAGQTDKNDIYAQLDELQKRLIPQAPMSTPLQNPNLIMPTPPPPQQPQPNPKMPQPVQPMQSNPAASLEQANRQMHPPQAAPPPQAPPPPPSRQGILYKPGKRPNRHFSWGI